MRLWKGTFLAWCVFSLGLGSMAQAADCPGLQRDLKSLKRATERIDSSASPARICQQLRQLQSRSRSVARRIDRDGKACGLSRKDAAELRGIIPASIVRDVCAL
jgi:hypothetical protein